LLILLSFLNIVFLSLCPSWFFQGLEDMKKIAIGELFGKFISLFLILYFIKSEGDINLIPIFYLIGQIFSLSVYIIFLMKYINFSSCKVTSIKGVFYKL